MDHSEAHRIETALTGLGYRQVTGVRPIGGGWESEIWEAWTASGPRAVRVFAGSERAHTALHEGRVMTELRAAGYPVPEIHNVVTSSEILDRPFLVMDLVDGGSLWNPGVSDRSTAAAVTAELMVRLHRIDSNRFDLQPWGPERWREEARPYVERFPGLGPPFDRLMDQIRFLPPVPCHNDLHPDNILQDSRGRLWVVDWTAFGVGDPRLDAAWTRMLGAMFGDQRFVSVFVDTYQKAASLTLVDPALDALTAWRRLADVLWFLTPEGSRIMRPGAGIEEQLDRLTVATTWIEDATGLRIPEVDAIVC